MHVPIGLQQLVYWCEDPTPHLLPAILVKCSEADLVEGMKFSGSPGRLCWAEYGRRRGFADFEIRAAVIDGTPVVDITAPGPAAHSSPIRRTS